MSPKQLEYINNVTWNNDGLVPAIAQDSQTNEVLMMAWMNRESLALSVEKGYATYWSRSRSVLWRKGETSGNLQRIKSIQLDCDGDTILLKIDQKGGIACHTGRRSCFFRALDTNSWIDTKIP